ncbi:lipopolysaccharide o-antigen ligase protein [Pandoraea eparura]|uniref:Lipopolysaccharide o-antigen ligase protein n=1 Tax=Pandoraea eparura TaxID=2508291 RepID=A0A5E4W645_9BURK|nr:O-antigen ligase family protein [Pandoraea eparura]VVE20108.1 lipopolysaccharide o-antigen ligase protein [Pandoraea eparura]
MPNVNSSAAPAMHPLHRVPNLLIAAFPAASLAIPRAANTLIIVASLIALCLCFQRAYRDAVMLSIRETSVRTFCYAMAAPIAAILLVEVWHDQLVASTLDSASRFLMAIPIFLILRTRRLEIAPWTGLSFAVGGISAAAVTVVAPYDWGGGRIGSTFLNPIHFGDIATILFVLSLMSIHWLARDNRPILGLKILGAACAGYASLAGGSRGGWVALPLIALVLIGVGMHKRPWVTKFAALIAAIIFISLPMKYAPIVMSRFDEIGTELSAMKHGDDDTSVGVRLKLYQAGVMLFTEHPWVGLGANGYKHAMAPLAQEDILTPHAAQLGRGETHNQIIAYAVDYGILGLFASLGLYLVPWLMFWRHRHASAPVDRRTALMGLIFVLSFFVFGLTVDTFTLKLTASVYAGILAVLAGLAPARVTENIPISARPN